MIIAADGKVIVEGIALQVLAESCAVMRSVYRVFEKEYGKEYANDKMVLIGRLAVMSEEDFEEALLWKH